MTGLQQPITWADFFVAMPIWAASLMIVATIAYRIGRYVERLEVIASKDCKNPPAK